MMMSIKMDDRQLNRALQAIAKDKRLNVWHISLLVALHILAANQGQLAGVKASRSKIMALSHINTFPTYHKYFRELQVLGYINYRPSYHPGIRSEIDLLNYPSL
jgi:hypothetical protein